MSSLWLVVLCLALLVLGVHRGLLAVAGLPSGEPLLVALLAAQAVAALAAAAGLWLRRSWGAVALVVLGVVLAAASLVEGFVFGIRAPLGALALAILAVLGALALASASRSWLRAG